MSTLYPCISDYTYTGVNAYEVFNSEELLDATGYIDPSTYIAQALAAGETLDAIRNGTYEYDDDGEGDDPGEPEIDPTRAGWIDPSDIDQLADGLKSRMLATVPENTVPAGKMGPVSANPPGDTADPTPPAQNNSSPAQNDSSKGTTT